VIVLNKSLQEINIRNMNVELAAQMFKNYQSNVLFHLEGEQGVQLYFFIRLTDISSDRQPETTFLNMVHATADVEAAARTPKAPPARIWQASDPPFRGYQPADPSGWQKSNTDTAIVIDNGMHVSNST